MGTIKTIYIVAGCILLLVLYGLFATFKAVFSIFFKLAPTLLVLYDIFKLYKAIINEREDNKNKNKFKTNKTRS